MNICGPYILLRVYLDEFAVNNPIESSRDKDKIMGVYYTPFVDLKFGSKRSTIQTLGLFKQSDIDHFTLRFCLQKIVSKLKKLVSDGIYDPKTQQIIQVRLICCLGDNLGQVEIAGLRKNFSKIICLLGTRD